MKRILDMIKSISNAENTCSFNNFIRKIFEVLY